MDQPEKFEQDSGIETDLSEDLSLLDAGKERSYKFDDPLSEPIVKMSLRKVEISPSQLINMSVKELNKRLLDSPSYVVSKLKRCRRTMKNRGYAKNCRIKRIAAKNHLEQVNMKLMVENRELRQCNRNLMDQLNQFRANQVTTVELKFEPARQPHEIGQPHGIYTGNRQQVSPDQVQQYYMRPDCNTMPSCAETNVYNVVPVNDYTSQDFDNLLCENAGFLQHSCS